MEQALAICTANLKNRVTQRTTSYVLYYSNNSTRYDGKITGFTIKQLVQEFRALGSGYKFAFITKVDSDDVLRYYNNSVSKKFFSMTRKGGKRTKKVS